MTSFSWVLPGNWGFPCGSAGKESACNGGDLGSVSGLGRSPGEGNGYPLQYPVLENSVDRGPWRATVHGVAKSQAWLRDFHMSKISLLAQMHTLLTLSLKNDAFCIWSLLISWYYFGTCSSCLISRLATLLTGVPSLSLSSLYYWHSCQWPSSFRSCLSSSQSSAGTLFSLSKCQSPDNACVTWLHFLFTFPAFTMCPLRWPLE